MANERGMVNESAADRQTRAGIANAPFQDGAVPKSPAPKDARDKLNADREAADRAASDRMQRDATSETEEALTKGNPYDDYMQDFVQRARDKSRENHELVDRDRDRFYDELKGASDGAGSSDPVNSNIKPPMGPEEAATIVGASQRRQRFGASHGGSDRARFDREMASLKPSLARRALNSIASLFGGGKADER